MSFDQYLPLFSRQFINGEWVTSSAADTIPVENPADRSIAAHIPDGTEEDIDRAVEAAFAAGPAWTKTPLAERRALMVRFLEHFRSMREAIIELEALELGAPVSFAASAHCDYQFTRVQSYIDETAHVAFEEAFERSDVIREPVGVVGCITPWNYPLGQIVQKVVPALLTGNTVVLKPSQLTPLTACLMTEAFRLAGFPKGTVNLVNGRGSRAGARLAVNPKVAMISFTGSTAVGVELSREALKSVKRISLELGGKSPCIWLDGLDDYTPAARLLMNSIFLNSGQTCTALSRLLVPRERLAEFEKLLCSLLPEYPAGDPLDPAVRIGPLASRQQFETVSSYIRLGLSEGARMIAGSVPQVPGANEGWYVHPVIFSDVKNSMRIAREEIFGPVLCIIPYASEAEALAIANDTPYGLNAMVAGPKDKANAFAREIHAGNVYVNDGPRDVTAPFGGYGASGIGREGGRYGLMEFTQLKAIFNRASW